MTSSSTTTTTIGRWPLSPILLLLLLVSSPLVASHLCPRDCECSESFDHAKCTSLDGFQTIEKNLPIRSLDLSNAGITRLSSQLEKLKNLTELDLSNNRLSEVNRLSKRIKTLDLSNNRLTSGKLRKIPQSVQRLNLSHNDITYLPLELMKLTHLRVVELAGNPINCTCDTLHVRNWLTQKHVWSDKHIKCMAPQEYKGRPWLQVKQADVCSSHRTLNAQTSYNWDDDDNDLMMGDQPESGSGHSDLEDDEDKKTYLPVESKKTNGETVTDVMPTVDEEDYEEGSGDKEEVVETVSKSAVVDLAVAVEGSGDNEEEVAATTTLVPDYYDESEEGSGAPFLVGLEKGGRKHVDVSSEPPTTSENPLLIEDSDEDDSFPISSPDESSTHIGIFEGNKRIVATSDTEVEEEVFTKKTIVPDESDQGPRGVVPIADGEHSTKGPDPNVVKGSVAAEDDNKSTYILLAVLGIILICLILFVACKRKNSNNRNRTDKADVEKAKATELQNMDRRNPGKPIEKKNGIPDSIYIPLIDRDNKDGQKPVNGSQTYDKPKTQDERDNMTESKPLLSSFKPIEEREESHVPAPANNDSNNNANGNLPNGSTSPSAAPRSSLPGVHQSPNSLHIPDNNDDDVFMPASETQPTPKRYSPIYSPRTPKSDRYSPVYSPETGRVKIKLSETPKPKTPILVTRSRSRAGDYITTESDPV